MGKIVIHGNETEVYWAKQIEAECQFCKVVDLYAYDINAISNYLTDNISEDTESIVIDSDSITSTELCLALALCVRLLISDLKRASLCGITIVSSLGVDSLLGYNPYSMLLGTAGFKVTDVEDSLSAINSNRAISYSEYVYEVVGRIKVLPDSGRHSIANEWGAGVLYSIVSGHKKEWKTGRVTLYAMYSYAAALQVSEVESIVLGGSYAQVSNDKIVLNTSCKCLLIDDEARKGWDAALEAMLPKSQLDVYDKEASDYESLPECLRKNIKEGKYDIIFLDLRMVGIKEDAQNNPAELSGMKILKGIKKINKGIQVIMLTATNKSWNVKALLDAGANGYYMKESPEYRFSNSFSRENAYALRETIKQCYDNSFLQDVYVNKERIKKNSQLPEDICKQLDISFNLICKATNDDDIAFAYIALEQIFEICSKSFISYRGENERSEKIAFFNKDNSECLDYTQRKKLPLTNGSPLYLKVMAIYCQLFKGTSIRVEHLMNLIRLRNDYMHMNNKNERAPSDSVRKPRITKDNYCDLFDTMFNFLNVIE
mgnify:CR=1 FL=1